MEHRVVCGMCFRKSERKSARWKSALSVLNKEEVIKENHLGQMLLSKYLGLIKAVIKFTVLSYMTLSLVLVS